MSTQEIDFTSLCRNCGNWCCNGENPFASSKELETLGVNKIKADKVDRCEFLNSENLCSQYEKRPFECQIFPYDIQEIKGKLVWILWNTCRVKVDINREDYLCQLEKEMKSKYGLDYVRDYVNFHKKNQPIKYKKCNFNILREINW